MKKNSKKLTLGRETLRTLGEGIESINELANVAGGTWGSGRTFASKWNCSVGACNDGD